MPYESRGLDTRQGWIAPGTREPERFDASGWIQRDICDREPFPFARRRDRLRHLLPHARGRPRPGVGLPEMTRVGEGRVHRGAVATGGAELRLRRPGRRVAAPPLAGGRRRASSSSCSSRTDIHAGPDCHFPAGYHERLTPEERAQALWWERGFSARERVFIEHLPDGATCRISSPRASRPVRRSARRGTASAPVADVAEVVKITRAGRPPRPRPWDPCAGTPRAERSSTAPSS